MDNINNENTNKKNIVISIILIVVIIGVFGWYFLSKNNVLRGNDDKNNVTENNDIYDEDPREGENDTLKNNTKESDKGNTNTNSTTKNDKPNNNANNNNTPKNNEANVPRDDNTKNTDVDKPTENQNTDKQTEVPKENNNGSAQTQTHTQGNNTGTTNTNTNQSTTNSSSQQTQTPTNNQGNSGTSTSQSGSGTGSSGTSGGNGGNGSSGSGGSGTGTEGVGGTVSINNTDFYIMGFSACCVYDARDNVREIKFVKMAKTDIETRYKKAFFKILEADNSKKGISGDIKIWIEDTIMYIASDKKIALANSGTASNYPWKSTYTKYLQTIDFANVDTSLMTNMSDMFSESLVKEIKNLNKFNTSKVTNMARMFKGTWLTNIDLSSFNTSKVTDMHEMFNSANYLKKIYVSTNWTTSAVKNGANMFTQSTNLVGGNGTYCKNTAQNATVARIDKAGSPGCLTLKT